MRGPSGYVLGVLGGLLLAGALLGLSAAAQEIADRAVGRKLARQCQTCHGMDGFAQIPIAPHIGGEQADYLTRQLTAFRDGTRAHEMMSVVAKPLKDEQIADLAAWYAGHVASAKVTGDPAKAPEACVSCHGVDGIGDVESGAPNLAGESTIYIETQLKAFRDGKRKSDVMGPIAAGLSDEDIRAAADWYNSVQLSIERKDP